MKKATLKLEHSRLKSGKELTITGSKSESNRALILEALYKHIELRNLSNSDDTRVLNKALVFDEEHIDIHHAGTAMRFLTAYFAVSGTKKTHVLTGSSRMKERPIGLLVDALRDLGADIEYVENTGFPPLRIKGAKLSKDYVELPAHVSSQYISALLLIAPSLSNGLTIKLLGAITSRPYIEMTLSLLNRIGVTTEFKANTIAIHPLAQMRKKQLITIESDWSSASYYYSLIALSEIGTELKLSHYFKHSLQGDSVLQNIYSAFGVKTSFHDKGISLYKVDAPELPNIELDLTSAPDIAQTIAVTCFGLGMECFLTGLHTLKIKETDRLMALQTELSKLGAEIEVTENSLKLKKSDSMLSKQVIETYNDHRMAMAFAPLSLRGSLIIEDPDVVSKSYPDFWKDISTLGIQMK